MKRSTFLKQACLLGGGSLVWLPKGWGHDVVAHHHGHGHHHWILPHVRHLPRPSVPSPVTVSHIDAVASISGQKAKTTLTIEFQNPDRSRIQEGEILLPVPHGAVLSSFRLEGANGGNLKAKILPREEARRIYDRIVSQMKDPAILEFAGMGAVKSEVFPVPAGGSAKVRIVYEELLTADGERVEYVLPRSESLDYRVRWNLRVNWAMKEGIATAYSPTHKIKTSKQGNRIMVEAKGPVNPGAFRLSVLRDGKHKNPVASFLSHPDEKGDGGWFLMLMSPPKNLENQPKLSRGVTLVLDRSGSMAGEKLDQARAAALQVVEGLDEVDYFNLITYNESVAQFSPEPLPANRENVLKARNFINAIRVSGGTNIHGALTAAVKQRTRKGSVSLVLFLTDGLPTIGEASEKRIRESISALNAGKRRIFTFGVGVDVNTALLSRLADDSRATATYVLPKESVEVKVGKVFARLAGPLLGNPVLTPVDGKGNLLPGRIDDMIPHRLPDFFTGDQIVVTGRYHGTKRLVFRLQGSTGNKDRSFRFHFQPNKKRNPFVPRLWATRKIAILTDAIRDFGANGTLGQLTGDQVDRNDPRVKELVDEIVRLSTEHGILTEYTAFLARDGAVFGSVERQNETAGQNFEARAIRDRSGAKGANQDRNLWAAKEASYANPHNSFLNSKLKQEEAGGNVQQASDKAYYKRGDQWVDVAVAANSDQAVEEVEVGSEAFKGLVDRLVATERQSCLALGKNLEIVMDGRRYRIR